MDGYDFIAQYALVVLTVLCVAFRDAAPLMVNGNIEPVEHQRIRRLAAAARARAALFQMQRERVS